MKARRFQLENLDCANCAITLENGIRSLNCVKSVVIDFASLTMVLESDCVDEVLAYIKKHEPHVAVREGLVSESYESAYNFRKEAALLILSAILIVTGFFFEYSSFSFPWEWMRYAVFISVYFLSGWNVIASAVRDIFRKNFINENFLMTIATCGAFAIGALPEAAGVMFFFKIGEILQERSLNRSRRSIKAMMDLRPEFANRLNGASLEKISPEDISVGEIIVVRPGERVPLDAEVMDGSSYADTSAITGESVVRSFSPGDSMLAGYVNMTGVLTLRVTSVFSQSAISRILNLVENASLRKARTEKFITSFARYYTPAIVGISACVAFIPPLIIPDAAFSDWFYRALVILVISCPCALVISIPLGYFGGIGAASKNGILVKGSEFIDALAKVKTVVLDKTGTLTNGEFSVKEIVPADGVLRDDLLRVAAAAEAHSLHPVARAITSHCGEIDLSSVSDFQEIHCHGVSANVSGRKVLVGNIRLMRINSVSISHFPQTEGAVYVSVDGVLAGMLFVGDRIRGDSAEAVSLLHKCGISRLVMLTGDGKKAAEEVSEELGITEYFHSLLPQDKVRHLEEIIAGGDKNHKVAFAGDGINDAPVIARADVGIAMGGAGSDAAIESADVVIVNDSPLKVARAILIARKTRRIVYQNIIFAIAVKAAFVVLGCFGIAGMWEAVFGDIGVALIAIFNSLRASQP